MDLIGVGSGMTFSYLKEQRVDFHQTCMYIALKQLKSSLGLGDLEFKKSTGEKK